jgi:hypothetical protein
MYNKIIIDIRHSQVPMTKVTYVASHDSDFSMMLRE